MAGATAAAARLEHRTSALLALCRAGLDAGALRSGFLSRLRMIVPVDAAFFATVDPATLLFTSAVAEDPLGTATSLFLENEFGRRDVNKFAALAESQHPVSSLDQATSGDRATSPRYREVMAPLGFGDELRAALVVRNQCWGVLCLHRQNSPAGFSAEELRLVRRLAPHLAEGLRQAVVSDARDPAAVSSPAETAVPGIVVLDSSLALVSVSAEAERWLADVPDHLWSNTSDLPVPFQAVAARLIAAEREQSWESPLPAAVRLRGRSGRWLSLHATRLQDPAGPRIGIVTQAVPPAELGSLLLSAHDLTQAQVRVAALIIRGRSTREIVAELHISGNTVQEHLTAIFDKFGVRSRRELVAAVLGSNAR
ncbi:LuxR C-terminal-related transcriptional regulator [Streptomyces rishiriensis]|uniref:DNA-binding CsgD family transcriptional regulator n=1 Tax=Streptomyces rishiriensis TaxID=68264 RepID=A0ABU0NHI5_STRRH|nr:LuxR C-terminal-related transcriptional regulator [Streptomyces rishiriensis]MDQ0578567.1 DNA-binding CsgD family transcriptional regulator [Streptomyces rishiriensis]